MGKQVTAVIDCRFQPGDTNDFYTLGIWGKYCFEYVCEAVRDADCFARTFLLTDSAKIRVLANKLFNVELINEVPSDDSPKMLISGRAIFLRAETIRQVVENYVGGAVVPVNQLVISRFDNSQSRFIKYQEAAISPSFILRGAGDEVVYFPLPADELVVINSVNEFELALVLMKKRLGRTLLTNSILERINSKAEQFARGTADSICLVGHSQLDNWECTTINGKPVRNCGIRGISSVEYRDYILEKNLLNCDSDTFIVMHGTNDIVYPYSDEFIVSSIARTFDYIESHNPQARIYFILISHTNGRMDRSNIRINQLNQKLKEAFSSRVNLIDPSALDDEFGDLKSEYTLDGLHFSPAGYEVLQHIVEQSLRENEKI